MKKNKPDFFTVFAQLPKAHKAAVVVGLRMYAKVMNNDFGSITFSSKDISDLQIFDEAEQLDPGKAQDFASRLEMEI